MPQDLNVRALVQKACVEWENDLMIFLLGILKDRHQAEDALQRTMVSALRSAESARAETLRGWMFRVALNEARQIQRADKQETERREVLRRSSWFSGGPVLSDGEGQLLSNEVVSAVRSSMSRLPEEYRTVVTKRIYEGLSFAQIAAEMNVPLGTVLTWMRRALIRLGEDRQLKELS